MLRVWSFSIKILVLCVFCKFCKLGTRSAKSYVKNLKAAFCSFAYISFYTYVMQFCLKNALMGVYYTFVNPDLTEPGYVMPLQTMQIIYTVCH